jgi:hypothetical protein
MVSLSETVLREAARYDDMVSKSMNYTRLLQINRTYKLNLNATLQTCGKPGYDPACKYDYMYKTIINNTNLFTKEVDMDLCGDETSWAHGGYGESNSGIVFCVIGKPDVTLCGQTVIMSNVICTYTRAYIHHPKLHNTPTG